MTVSQAIAIAKQIAGNHATITGHTVPGERAVRISGCDLASANEVGRKIAMALPGGTFRQSGGFACVWYDAKSNATSHASMQEAEIEYIKSQA